MNRLTSDSDDLSFLCNHLNQKTNFDGNKIQAMHKKLKDYEETGLEPEEVEQVKAGIKEILKVVRERGY